MQRRYRKSLKFIYFYIETLNRLLGSSDAVADIKLGFLHNLHTPRKLNMPHGHLIKDLMRPDYKVQH